MMILFNVLELIFKSVRENFNEISMADIEDFKKQGLLSEDDYMLLSDRENGIRKIRYIMTHRGCLSICFEDSGEYTISFADTSTWTIIYELYAQKIIS